MKHRRIFEIIFVLILSLPIVFPLGSAGFFPMHDDTQVGRVVAMGKAIKDGQFPVRWVPDLGYGYGYPIFNFYGPLPYYFGGVLYAAGFSSLTATKIMIIVGMLLPALTMFLFMRGLTGFLPALAAGLLYGYAPYHAVQLYVRGAIGELWTLGFYPLLAWGVLLGIEKSKTRKAILFGSVGLAGVILSHTLLGFATFVFVVVALGIYWTYRFFKKQIHLSFIIYHLSFLFLGLGLSAFFWLPAVVEMKFTGVAGQVSSTADFRDHFVCLQQLWDSAWGFGGSAAGCIDGMSFKLGKIQIIVSTLGFIFMLLTKQTIGLKRLGWLGLAVVAVSLFLTLPVSGPLWELSPYFAYFQYPWRFLAPAAFGMSILGGVVFAFFRPEAIGRLLAIFTIGILLIINGKLFRPQYIIDRPAASYETKEELRWRVSSISDEYLPAGFRKPKSEKELPQGVVVDGGMSFSFQQISTSSADVTINKAYFPGWKYWINGVRVVPKISDGLPVLTVPKGKNLIHAQFTNTPVRTLGNIASLISLFMLGGLLWVKNRP